MKRNLFCVFNSNFIFIFLNPESFGLFFRGILPYLAGISLLKRKLFILKHGNEFPCQKGGIRNCKTRKGDSKYERKNTEKDSGTRFAWVFVWQRNVYHSRGNENNAEPRGHSGNKSINSKLNWERAHCKNQATLRNQL